MHKVTINGKTVQLPQNWIEAAGLDSLRGCFAELLETLYVYPASGATYHHVLRIMLGYSQPEWKKLMRHFFSDSRSQEQRDQSSEALAELLGLVSWMWKEELTVAPFQSVQVEGEPWLMFGDGFRSMSFGELTDAYIHAQAFIKQLVEGEERLNMLVATVCRPEKQGDYRVDPKWNGDAREEYNEHIATVRAGKLKGKLFPAKILVLVYFLGAAKNFFSYFDLFDSDGSGPPQAEEYPGQSMIKNQHLLSGKAIFGTMSETKKANVHEVFQFLEEHNKDVKAEIERIKASQQQ